MMKKTSRSESANIMRRLVRSMPASRYEMETLTRLADIKTTRALPSAAVECRRKPRLLINPDFVETYCQRDEHLFLLVMHELWHVLLAHTRLQPRMTEAHNIAFDAIINAELMHEFNRPEHMGFFDKINPPDRFPHCLLRPPVGWPMKPQYPEDVGPEGTKEMIMRLYPPANLRRHSFPLYEEVLRLLIKGGMEIIPDDVMLLGNHGDVDPIHDPVTRELLEEAAGKWPRIPGKGWGNGGYKRQRQYRINESTEDMRRTFAQVLKKHLTRRPGVERRKAKTKIKDTGGIGVLPNAKDRLAPARRALGSESMLWTQQTDVNVRLPEKPSRAFVYLDVSGSMNQVLPYILHLMLPYVAKKQAEVFQFSTVIHPLSWEELQQGKMHSSGGTNINCVFDHLLQEKPVVNQVIIVTDGMVGAPRQELAASIMDSKTNLHIVLSSNGRLHNRVTPLTRSVTRLPAM